MLMLLLIALVQPTNRPTEAVWDPKWFAYEPPVELQVTESAPTEAQLNFRKRPATQETAAATTQHSAPRRYGNLEILSLSFVNTDGESVPVLLCTPTGRKGPFPVVIAAHGFGSHKGAMVPMVAGTLAKRGFATLALDLPQHGQRPGDARDVLFNLAEPLKSFELFQRAVRDVRQCIDLAMTRKELDKDRIVLLGYSMGGIVCSIAGPCDKRVSAMVLISAGARDFPEDATELPRVAACRAELAMPHFAPRPVLMCNGSTDPLVTPTMAKRLYEACGQRKRQYWYQSGHLLPMQAIDDASMWVAAMLSGPPPEGGR